MSDDTQPQDRDIQIIVSTKLGAAIEKFGGADEFYFHFGISMLPTPEGMVCAGVVNVFLPNPLIGTGDMVVSMVIQDISALRNDDAIDEVAQGAVRALREQRSKLISGNAPAPPNGLLLP
jgi:hypothetical protein